MSSTPNFKLRYRAVLLLGAFPIFAGVRSDSEAAPILSLLIREQVVSRVRAAAGDSVALTPSVPNSRPVVEAEEWIAIQSALKLPNSSDRLPILAREMERWLMRDTDAAVAQIRPLPRSNEISQALIMALSGMARNNPDRALAVAREIVSAPEERAFYVILFDRLTREDVGTALPRLSQVPEEFRPDAVRTIANAWYQSDATAALDWAKGLSPDSGRSIALETILSSLAAREPRRAIEVAQKLLTGEEFDRTALRAIQIQASTDPVAAAELVPLLPPGDAHTNAAMNVAHALSVQNIDLALEWIKTLSIDITRWMALNSVLSTWAQKDSKAAARYVLEMRPGQHLDFAAGHLALFLAANPADAILWAEALPSDSARNAAYVSIASTWAQRSPRESLEWALTLSAEPLRTNAITAAHVNWKMRDPLAASTWLESSNLPAATKRKIEFGLR